MSDPYAPPLEEFSLSEGEMAVVAAALQTPTPWDYEPGTEIEKAAIKSIKARILRYHLQRHNWTCCYCRTNLYGAGPFMTDREHILPKGKAAYKKLSFTIWNIAAACKRCNMQFKKSGDRFVIDGADSVKIQMSENYRFVHPNFDRWEDHLTRLAVQVNAVNIVHITPKPGCKKAAYTHEFFSLRELEVDTFDLAQGLLVQAKDSNAIVELRKLADQFEQ